MKGIERIKILASKVKDKAVLKIVEYLISRTDMNEKYLNEEKSLKQMINFIKSEAKKEAQNGIAMIEDEKVYSWAIHYFDETNKDLGLDSDKNKETKEQIDIVNNYVDNYKDSKEFKKFIDEQKTYICIKNKNNCYCSKCRNEFKLVCKINDYIQCPNCKTKLLVKRSTNYTNKEYVMYLIKYNNQYIIRNYEVLSMYFKSKEKMSFDITEYGRQVINKDGTIELKIMINNMRKNIGGYWYISYFEKTEFWKP